MIKAEVRRWLQINDLTRLDYDARYAMEYSNLIGLVLHIPHSSFSYKKIMVESPGKCVDTSKTWSCEELNEINGEKNCFVFDR